MKQQTGTLNYQWAFSLIHYFSLQGIDQAVISPGSRSTPLALACEKHPAITARVDIDERSAGFFALGLSQSSQHPVLLICTSGTAVANWLPAVIEAAYSYTPLILLSADRPDELQHCGANQTIDQQFLFGSHVREFIQLEHPEQKLLQSTYLKKTVAHACTKSRHAKPGPVHINIPLREPLLPRRFTAADLNHFIDRIGQDILSDNTRTIHSVVDSGQLPQARLPQIQAILEKPHGLIICGRLSLNEQSELHTKLQQLAEKLNCPVLIDPLSGLRLTGSDSKHLLVNYDTFLDRSDLTNMTPDWIIHFGQFPLSKKLLQYLQLSNCTRIMISSYGDTHDPLHHEPMQKNRLKINCLPLTFCQTVIPLIKPVSRFDWLAQWQKAEQQAQIRITQALNNTELFEGHIIDSLLKQVPEQSLIFSGNSMAIRDFDTFIDMLHNSTKQLSLFANRGASGIDGNISTFAGLLAANLKRYAVAVLGDLSFFHDMNGLLMIKQLQEQGYNGTIILINNNGGGIFNYLPPGQLNEFEKLWQTDTKLEFKHSAALYKLNYFQINSKAELDKQLAQTFSLQGFSLIEVIIDPQTSVKCHKLI